MTARKKKKKKKSLKRKKRLRQKETKKATKSKAIDKLVALGKEKGHLTYEQVNDILPDDMFSSEEIDEVMEVFDKEDIALVDHEKSGSAPANEQYAKKDAAKEETTQRPTQVEDPVKMYLRQMGQIPLLTREEEITLAERIKNAENVLRKNVLGTNIAKDIVLDILDEAFKKEINLDEIIDIDPKEKEYVSRRRTFKLLNKLKRTKSKNKVIKILLDLKL